MFLKEIRKSKKHQLFEQMVDTLQQNNASKIKEIVLFTPVEKNRSSKRYGRAKNTNFSNNGGYLTTK